MSWLSGWSFRKSLALSSIANGTRIPISIHKGAGTDNESNVYVAGKIRSDFGDFRPTKPDGTTVLTYSLKALASEGIGKNITSVGILSDGTIIAGTTNAIYRKPAGGEWSAALKTFDVGATEFFCMFVASNDDVYCSIRNAVSDAENGLWKHVHDDEDWTNWVRVLDLSSRNNTVIWGIDEDSGGRIFCGDYSGGTSLVLDAAIWRSDVNGGLPFTMVYDASGVYRDVVGLAVDKTTDHVYANLVEFEPNVYLKIQTVNHGANWSTILAGAPRCIAVAAHSGVVFWGTHGDDGAAKIYRSTDTVTETLVYTGDANSRVNWIRIDSLTGKVLVGILSMNSPLHASIAESRPYGRNMDSIQAVFTYSHE